MIQLVKQIQQVIQASSMVSKGDLLVVAVSGGVDSVALLDILCELRHRLGIRLHVAHYDHRMRSTSSNDALFVKNLAVQYSLSFSLGQRKGASNLKLSEDKARQLRVDFLTAVALKLKASAVVTAHHQNDLAETVLMRVIRGTGLAGLRGVLPESSWGKVKVIRPLLSVSRSQLEQYIAVKGLTHVEDETNASMDFLRNRMRHELIPQLTTYNPNVVSALVNLAQTSVLDYDFLRSEGVKIVNQTIAQTKTGIKIPIDQMNRWHPAMRNMVLRLSLERLCGNLNTFEMIHIQQIQDFIASASTKKLVLPRSVRLSKSKGMLILSL